MRRVSLTDKTSRRSKDEEAPSSRELGTPLSSAQLSNAEPGKLRRIIVIFDRSGVGSGRPAYRAFGNCAMVYKPVASQNIDDRSAQRHLPIRIAVIVEHYIFAARQHIKNGID